MLARCYSRLTGGATIYLNEKYHISDNHGDPNESKDQHDDANYNTASVAGCDHPHSVEDAAESRCN